MLPRKPKIPLGTPPEDLPKMPIRELAEQYDWTEWEEQAAAKQKGQQAVWEIASRELNKALKKRLSLTVSLGACQHYYEVTGNILFALEAFKIFHDNKIEIKTDDWFIEPLTKLTADLLIYADKGTEGLTAPQALYEAFYLKGSQKGRSIFAEYSKYKEHFEIYEAVQRLLDKGEFKKIAYAQVAEEYSKSADTIEKIYDEERKILDQGFSFYLKNSIPRKRLRGRK